MNKEAKAAYDTLSEDEQEALFILAQRNQAERKGHKLCVDRCDDALRRLAREHPLAGIKL